MAASLHVIRSPEPTPEASEDVIASLQMLLEQARAGELVALAFATMHRDSCVAYGTCGDPVDGGGTIAMVGAVDLLHDHCKQHFLEGY